MKKHLLIFSFLFSTILLFSQTKISISPTDTIVCKNAAVKIILKGFSNTATFEWVNSLGQTISTQSFIDVKKTSSEQYFCYVIDKGKKDTLSSKVEVKDKIFVPIMASDTNICEGTTIVLSTNFKGSSPLEWTHPQGDAIACSDSVFCSKISISPKSTWTYTFEDKSTCYFGKPIQVKVEPKPSFASPTEIVLCIGTSPSDSIILNKAPIANAKYEWSQVGNPIFNSKLAAPKVLPKENATYNVKISKGICKVEETVKLIAANIYKLSVTKDTMICPNTPIKLEYRITPTPPEFVNEWSPGGNGNPIEVTSSQSTNYILKLSYPSRRVANTYYCTTYDTVKVVLKNSKKIDIQITPSGVSEYALGQDIVLNVTPSTNSPNYIWQKDGKKLTENKSSLKDTLRSAISIYSVVYKDEFGCQPSTSITVKAYKPEVLFPTIFNAGTETFRPFYKDLKEGVVSIERFQIYNRWGQNVYELDDKNGVIIDDNFKGWDGKKDDKEMPTDVYVVYYRIRYGDKSFKDDVMNVTLVR